MKVGDRVTFKYDGERGEIIYSAVLTMDNVGATGIAVVNPTILRQGIITEHKKSWFNGLFYDYWLCVSDDGKIVKLRN